MKKLLIIMLIIGSIVLVACTENPEPADIVYEVTDFESCIEAGGIEELGPTPNRCLYEGETFTKENVLDGCKHYFDGCNSCTIEKDGTTICTTAYCEPEDYEEPKCLDKKVTDFESCIAAGYPAMESYPRQCTDGTDTYTEKIEQKACTREYMPVCGELAGEKQTFSNRCMAENAGAENIVEGECEEIVGNDRDEHGCIGSAGYIWDEEIGSCIRPFEKGNICELAGGIWLEQYNECEYTSKNICERYDGRFDACASACRNEPDAEICTKQCVPVCTF